MLNVVRANPENFIKDRPRHRAESVPAHFIQSMTVDVAGKRVIDGQIGTSVSRNPVFGFKVKGAKAGDKVVWLLELQQAGAFVIKNLSAPDLAQVLSIMAPNYLLSYARSTVSELVTKGGFPPFLLPLVTFEALHARAAQQAAAVQAGGPATVN